MRYLKNLVSAIFFMILNRIIGLFTSVQTNKILFISDVRAELGGNLKNVYDYLDPDQYIKVTYLKADRRERSSFFVFLQFIYDMTTAEYIMLEDYFRYTSYFKVKQNQQICQLWHAAGAFKKFGYSRKGGNEHIKIHRGYKKYAKAIVSAEDIRWCYAEAFGIDQAKVQATGIPRTDVFFDKDYIFGKQEELYRQYPMLRDKKVILFAPTYRGIRADDASYDFSKINLDKFYRELKDEYVFVFKWHPAVYNNILREDVQAYQTDQYDGFYLDLSREREVEDLLLITDVLVTDYSSIIFDYFLLDKPIIYYAYDLDSYAGGRGLYYDFEDYVYGPVVKEQEDLIQAIREGNQMKGRRKSFGKQFMEACDGHATERTCKWIFDGSVDKINDGE